MIKVIAVDKNKQRHVAEVLSNAEYAHEGAAGAATIARNFCVENGLSFRDWRAEPASANEASNQAVA
jgi:hypothetical protein